MKKTLLVIGLGVLLSACGTVSAKKDSCSKSGKCSMEFAKKDFKGKKAWNKCGKADCKCHKKAWKKATTKKCPNCKPFKNTPCVKPMPVKKVEEVVLKPMPTHIKDLEAVAIVKETDKGIKLTFNDPILFATNSDAILEASKKEVVKIAKVLAQHPNAKTVVEGYTDNTGDAGYNLQLSERRARTVANLLIKEGVKAENVTAVGFGIANPVDTNDTKEGRLNNRRVELDITTK